MIYSMSDIYGRVTETLSTTEQTIPEEEENNFYVENTTENAKGQKVLFNGKMVWGAFILFVLITVVLHFIE